MSFAVKTLAPPGASVVGLRGDAASGRLPPGMAPGSVQIAGIAGQYPSGCQWQMTDSSGCKHAAAMGTELCMAHLRRAGRYEATKREWDERKAAKAKERHPDVEPIHRKAD